MTKILVFLLLCFFWLSGPVNASGPIVRLKCSNGVVYVNAFSIAVIKKDLKGVYISTTASSNFGFYCKGYTQKQAMDEINRQERARR